VSRNHARKPGAQEPRDLDPKWYTVSQVANLLGYGETKVRMLIISGDLRSLKDGRSRRVLRNGLKTTSNSEHPRPRTRGTNGNSTSKR
jgi:excisionase family DNA binding protein